MTAINIDVIALVIDNVEDDRGTLFSLLTVNKQVFRYTCSILYRAPFRFFRENHDDSTLKNKMSLLQLLLALSPAADANTNLARGVFGAPPMHGSELEGRPAALLDYLSFIQYARLEYFLIQPQHRCLDTMRKRLDLDSPAFRFLSDLETFKSTVTWSICGHQLGQLRELEIEVHALERFIEVAPQLCRLRVVVVGSLNLYDTNLMTQTCTSAVRLVQALQQHHGKDQLRDFRLTKCPDLLGNKTIFSWDVAIRKMFPPLLPHDLKVALPLRPMDSYLSRLTELRTVNSRTSWWTEISKEYTDVSVGQLLQRCRSLDLLHLDFAKGGINDPSLLSWAVNEKHERAAGRLLAPAVPLENLHLELADIATVDAFRVLKDGISAFRTSLQKLWVRVGPSERGEVNEELQPVPFLQHESMMMLRLWSLSFASIVAELLDVCLLQSCPNLTILRVSLGKCQSGSVPHRGWPVLHLPHLTDLELFGQAVYQFDPASFRDMPKLQSMRFEPSRLEPDSLEDGPTFQNHWTWDWDLPKLGKVHLQMDLSEAKFSFRFLQGCPNLTTLHLVFLAHEDKSPYPLDVSSALKNTTQYVSPELYSLQLSGHYTLQQEDLRVLVGSALPALWDFKMDTVGSCTREQVDELIQYNTLMDCYTVRPESKTEEWALRRYTLN